MDELAGLSPMDLMRLRAEMAGRYVSEGERQANLAQTRGDMASVAPIVGNAMSMQNAYGHGQEAYNQASQGNYGQAAQQGGLAGLNGLAAFLGLPIGRVAAQTARGASNTMRAGPPTPWAGWTGTQERIADDWAAKMAQQRYAEPFNAKPYYDEMAGANAAARADPQALAAETAQRMRHLEAMRRYANKP